MTANTSGLVWVPDACTLPTRDQPLRMAEFDELFSRVEQARWLSPTRLRLTLAGTPDLEGTVRDLTARETQCCSFFTFTLASAWPGRLRLDIEVPDAYAEILDAVAARAVRIASTR